MRFFRGNTLVGLLVVILIVAILAVVVTTGGFGDRKSTRKDGIGTTVPGAVRAKALDTTCANNLQQIRMKIQMYMNTEDQAPASLQDLGLPKEMLRCPIGKEPYEYDPATGQVRCKHPGHEGL